MSQERIDAFKRSADRWKADRKAKTEVREKKKANRQEGRKRIKEIRKDKTMDKKQKRGAIKFTRYSHQSDKEGNKRTLGDLGATTKKRAAQTARRKKVQERIAARKEARKNK